MFDLNELVPDSLKTKMVYDAYNLGDDLYFERTNRGVPITQRLGEALSTGYTHNILNEDTVWLTPVSEDVIPFGNGHPYNVIHEVIECFEKHMYDSPMIVFITKCGWFVIKMEYSESRIPNKPCLSFSGGMIRSRTKLWHSYFRQLKASTSNYNKYVDCTG